MFMTKFDSVELGQQLMKPTGETGIIVGENMNVSNVEIYSLACTMMEFNVNDKILEIGFGNGRFFSYYFNINSNINVFGVDHSETMYREAMILNNEYIDNKKLILKLEDSLKTSFVSDYFDTIISINTIYFWKSIDDQIEEICRLLKSRGKLIIGFRPKSQLEHFPYTKEGFKLFESSEIIDLFKKHDLKFIKEKTKNVTRKAVDGQDIDSKEICLAFKNCKKKSPFTR